ncbi:MAG: OsmC family protein [Pseudomonadota bacterium]
MSQMSTIVSKSTSSPAFEKIGVTTFVKPRHGEQMNFEVNLVAESGEGMQKRALVEPNLPTWSPFELNCDEGGALGGTDDAPPPLGYLSAGIAFCLLTHLTAFVRAKKMDIQNIRIEQRTKFSTTLVTDAEQEGDFRGRCEGVETHVIVEGNQSPEEVAQLAQASENACMAMQAIMNATPTNTTLYLNGSRI